jgi:hypothetical protein
MLIAGGMEAIFVMSGRTSTGGYGFNATNITPPSTGSSVVIIFEPQDMPFNVVFTDGLSNVDAGEPFTLVASADIPVDTYYWFKNGVEIPSEHNATLTRNAPADERYDNYSVLAQAGGALASAQKIITSVIPPPTFTAATWIKPLPGTKIDFQVETYTYIANVFGPGGVPLPDGITLYWKVTDNNGDWTETIPASSVTSGGKAQAVLTWDGNSNDCRMTVTLSELPGGAGFASVNANLLGGNY